MKHLTKTLLAALFVSSMTGCGEQEEPNYSQSGEMKLNVEAALSDMAGSRAPQADGVYFNIAVESPLDFNLSLGEQTKGMKLGENGKVTYAEGVEPFSVELIEYPVRAEGDALNAVPLSLVRGEKSYHFSSPIALNATVLTPSKAEGEAQATLNLPFKVASTGLRIDFTLYNIVPTAVTPCVGGYTNEAISLSQEDGSLFQKTGGDDVKTTYTIIIPFTAHTGAVAAGAEVAKLATAEGEYVIKLPADKGIDFASNSLYRMSVVESLNLDLETISCTVEDWNETQVSATVAGKDFEVKEGTYYIYSAKGLEEWRKVAAESGTTNAKLMNDITLTENWGRVGKTNAGDTKNKDYTGTFEGNNHQINGLNIETGDGYIGFIASLGANGKVQNLSIKVKSISSTSNGQVMGGIVGNVAAGASIENCTLVLENGSRIISEDKVAGNQYGFYAGGIAGKSLGTIKNCTVLATGDAFIQAKNSVGGISGYLEGGTMENCHVSGVSLVAYVLIGTPQGDAAGIVGELKDNAQVIACSSANYKIACGNRAGGIAGRLNGENIVIMGCYSVNGQIDQTYEEQLLIQKAGGIVGEANAKATNKITACYSANLTMATKDSKKIGGIIGNNTATVSACYTTATQAGSGITVPAITYAAEGNAMNDALSDAKVNWEYIDSDDNPFPLTIQQSTQE